MLQVILETKENVYVRLTEKGLWLLENHITQKGSISHKPGGGSRKTKVNDYLIRNDLYCFNFDNLMHIFGGEAISSTFHPFVDDKIYLTEPPE